MHCYKVGICMVVADRVSCRRSVAAWTQCWASCSRLLSVSCFCCSLMVDCGVKIILKNPLQARLLPPQRSRESVGDNEVTTMRRNEGSSSDDLTSVRIDNFGDILLLT